MENHIQFNQSNTTTFDKAENIPVKDIPVIELGIHSYEKRRPSSIEEDYILVLKSDSIENTYIAENAEEAKDPIKETESKAPVIVASSNDYQDTLEKLHTKLPKYIPEGETHNHVDDYIHSYLKKGIPDAHGVMHVLDTIKSANDTVGSDPRKYLLHKYSNLLAKYSSTPHKAFNNLEEISFTPEEAKKIHSALFPHNASFFMHDVSRGEYAHKFQIIPKKNYMGYLGVSPFTTKKIKEDDHEIIHDDLFDIESKRTSNDISQYTADSVPYNKYLHLVHSGRSLPSTLFGKDLDEIENVSNNITDFFDNENKFAVHTKSIPVYTGMYARIDPESSSVMKDSEGNLIYHNPGFTSTSLSHDIADGFAKTKPSAGYNHPVRDIMKINIPGGYPHGSYIGRKSQHSDEYEYLLDKGHTFKLNPNPKVYNIGHGYVREWNAELAEMPDTEENLPFRLKNNRNKISLLMRKNVSPEHLISAATDINDSVRAAAAKRSELPESLHKTLINDVPIVRQAAMLRPNLKDEIIDQKLAENDLASLKHIAEYKEDLSPKYREIFLNHDYSVVASKFARRKDLTEEEQDALIKRDQTDPVAHASLALNSSVSQNMLRKLHSLSQKRIINMNLALNRNTPYDVLDDIAHDAMSDREIRTAAYNNPNMHRDGEELTAEHIAKNPYIK